MQKFYTLLVFVSVVSILTAQEVKLPEDLRQHNLGMYNTSLVNPAFSLNANSLHTIALWTRWQWQAIDEDPTSLFFNYTGSLNDKSTIGAGFFQNNTGVFSYTGGVANYAYVFDLSATTKLSVGVNVFGYKSVLSDNRFNPNPEIELPQLKNSNDFILQIAPGIMLSVNQFSVGISSENSFDYNFTKKEAQTSASDKMYLGFVSYAFPLEMFGSSQDTYVKPMMYIKTIPNHDTQFGLNTVFSTSKFWGQVGYNNFYGISAGAGAKLFQKLSIGLLMEFGIDDSLKDKDSSIEIVTAFSFGGNVNRNKIVDEEEEAPVLVEEKKEAVVVEKPKKPITEELKTEKEVELVKVKQEEEKKRLDSIAKLEKENALAVKEKLKQANVKDSISKIRKANAMAAVKRLEANKAKLLAAENKKVALAKVVKKPKKKGAVTNGHYEEVTSLEGVASGYYLVANIFGTKKYFENFMKNLKKKGFNPGAFYRKDKKHNYVYLERFDTLSEIEKARDSKYDGRYKDTIWVFRVVGEK
ncbi:MAG: PorP/SprF family type IX secretion system membrane protein [Cellulophaga sp.]